MKVIFVQKSQPVYSILHKRKTYIMHTRVYNYATSSHIYINVCVSVYKADQTVHEVCVCG